VTDPEQIRADIVATRAELAETADAIAARLEQKARVGMWVAVAAGGLAVTVLIVQRVRKHTAG
jgi:hypothetical protein